jgi:hypothetical protein
MKEGESQSTWSRRVSAREKAFPQEKRACLPVRLGEVFFTLTEMLFSLLKVEYLYYFH